MVGIDVSTWQRTINWDKVKKAGIDFAIIRCGWGTTGVDNQFHRNIKEARRVGIKVGVYLYSYAHGVAEAQAEAKHCLDLVREYGKLDMPIYYDEEESYQYSRAKELAIAFCTVIENAGYWAGVYSSSSKWQGPLKGLDRYTKWVADWGKDNSRPAHNAGKPNVSGCDLHQYSSVGNVSGISGDVDMNELYRTSLFDEIAGKSSDKPAPKPKKTNAQVAVEVWEGKWGTGDERKKRLTEAGYDYNAIQDIVNQTEPEGSGYDGRTYVVQEGDTLTAIARKYNTTVAKLKKKNSIPNANLIYVGQVIRVD